MPKYQIAPTGVDPIANPLPKEHRRLPWFWILLMLAMIACGVTFAITRSSVQADSNSKPRPTPTLRVTPLASDTPGKSQPGAVTTTLTSTMASTQTPWIVTREVTREVTHEVIVITIQLVDHQVIVPQEKAVVITVKVPWVMTQIVVITTTPLPTYSPYPTQTNQPSQTPWVVTVTPSETITPSLTPYFEPVTDTPTPTIISTETVTPTP